MEATKDDKPFVFFIPLSPVGGDFDEEEPFVDHTIPQKVQLLETK